jgi:hypothetical protein
MLHNSRISAICKEFNVKVRQAERYIVAAREEISRGNNVNRVDRRNALRSTLESVVEDAIANGDGRTAVSGLRELVHLDGVAEPERIQVDSTHTIGLTFDPAILREQIRQAALEHPEYVRGLLGDGDCEIEAVEVVPAASLPKPSNGSNGTNGAAK